MPLWFNVLALVVVGVVLAVWVASVACRHRMRRDNARERQRRQTADAFRRDAANAALAAYHFASATKETAP